MTSKRARRPWLGIVVLDLLVVLLVFGAGMASTLLLSIHDHAREVGAEVSEQHARVAREAAALADEPGPVIALAALHPPSDDALERLRGVGADVETTDAARASLERRSVGVAGRLVLDELAFWRARAAELCTLDEATARPVAPDPPGADAPMARWLRFGGAVHAYRDEVWRLSRDACSTRYEASDEMLKFELNQPREPSGCGESDRRKLDTIFADPRRARQTLKDIGKAVDENMGRGLNHIRVRGHADKTCPPKKTASGCQAYNDDLSRARAECVALWLTNRLRSENKVNGRDFQVSIEGFGDARSPCETPDDPACNARSRRIELAFKAMRPADEAGESP